ncbi:MAG: three-Cys-motif partner protein TcmP [Nitrospira sp.]|nr:three-Cys-motif partner protein TcmP [Nitrospira sp.]
MTNQVAEHKARYGGRWTIEKLNILERYLDVYTTALKDTPFKLMYIDAFAGTGQLKLSSEEDLVDIRGFVSGSAERAIKIENKPFDELIFVEKKRDRFAKLKSLQATYSKRKIEIVHSDANEFLANLHEDWRSWRGVLFLDPFATEVKWATIETIASFNALDTWILFPVSAITRMLPKSRKPNAISPKWTKRLTQVFGDESWHNLYQEDPQGNLFGDIKYQRNPGVDGLIDIYKEKLRTLFGTRFLETSRALKNSKNSPLFEFMFCVGNPNGIGPAKRIAEYILEHM